MWCFSAKRCSLFRTQTVPLDTVGHGFQSLSPLAELIRIQIFFLFSLFQNSMAINFKIMINRIQII